MNLNDFERAAKAIANKRTWTYYSSASDDLISHRRNLEDWSRVMFRPRVLRNVQKVNMRRTILGHDSSLPIFIAPAALGRLGHPDGELCLTRGASRHNIPYAVSTASSVSIDELSEDMKKEDAQGCMFYQLYVKKRESETRAGIRRARFLGFKGLMVTVDTPVVGKREEDERFKAELAHESGIETVNPVTAVSAGEVTVLRGPFSSTLNWDDLKWIREEWNDAGPICLKGISTAEDARMAYEMGIKSIYLSNHGGRQLDGAPSSLRTLLEIRRFCPEVFDGCEVLIDGGVRRGTDVLKALCLGAKAVGVGRPCMYALTAYGTEGVTKVIQSSYSTDLSLSAMIADLIIVLSDELETSMRLLGVTDVNSLRPHMVNTRELEALVMTDLPGMGNSRARL